MNRGIGIGLVRYSYLSGLEVGTQSGLSMREAEVDVKREDELEILTGKRKCEVVSRKWKWLNVEM